MPQGFNTMQGPDILVGGFERELLRMSSWDERDPETKARLERSVRLAVLYSSDHAVIPASGYFETSCCYPVLLGLRPSQERGQLVLQGSAGGPDEYVAHKLAQWKGSAAEQKLYSEFAGRRIAALDSSAWRSKSEPTDRLIVVNWGAAIEQGNHPLLKVFDRVGVSPSRAEKDIAAIPDSMEGTVFLVDNIIRRLRKPRLRFNMEDRNMLRVHLAKGFFGSYLNDSGASVLVGPTVGMQETMCPADAGKIKARSLCDQLRALGHEQLLLDELDAEQFAVIADSAPWRSLRPKLLVRAQLGIPYLAEEQRALRKAGSIPKGSRTLETRAIESALSRQHEALERVERQVERRPGTALGPGITWDARERLELAMESALPAVPPDGYLPRSRPPIDMNHLANMLLQVLKASSPEEARGLIRMFDSTLDKYEELRPEVVAELIKEREDLADQVRTIPSSARFWLFQVSAAASGNALGKGLELAFRALLGG
jgi:hypothetical protein